MAPADPKAVKIGNRRRGALRPTGGLKALADVRKNDESLILGPAQQYVVDREARDLSRRQDIIHPSEMSHSDWCPKATYLRIKNIREGGEYVKEAFGFQSLNIFDHGHEVHDKWQKRLWKMGLLWGDWECQECDYYWTAQSPERCPVCKSGHLKYKEIPLDAEHKLLISGSADGGVPKHKTLLEFKTVGTGTLRIEEPKLLREHTHKTIDGKNLVDYEGLWRGITRPFSSHQKQGQTYLKICEILGLDFDKVTYIYESKFNQGTKEFVVKRRESIIEGVLESADEIRQALEFGGPPPKCPKNGCKHCDPNKESASDGEESAAPARRRGAPVSSPEDVSPTRRARSGLRRETARRRRTEAP